MIAFITVWLVSAFLAGLILLFDPDRKAQRKKDNSSFVKSYVDAVKREWGPGGGKSRPW
jgi:hypothetical protein